MNNSKLELRFSFISKTNNKNEIDDLLSELPKSYNTLRYKNEEIILLNGKKTNRFRTENVITYLKKFDGISDIENCNNYFVTFWEEYKDLIKNRQKLYEFELLLDYELTIYDLNYPSLYFKSSFHSFLTDLDILFTLYFYNENA